MLEVKELAKKCLKGIVNLLRSHSIDETKTCLRQGLPHSHASLFLRHLPCFEATWGWILELWPGKNRNTEFNLLNTLKNVDTNTLKALNQKFSRKFDLKTMRDINKLNLTKIIAPLISSLVIYGLEVMPSRGE